MYSHLVVNTTSNLFKYTLTETCERILVIVSGACSGNQANPGDATLVFSYSNPDVEINKEYESGNGSWGSLILRVYSLTGVKEGDIITNKLTITKESSYLYIGLVVIKL